MSAARLNDYLEDMMGAAKRACKFVEGMPMANFFEDEKTQQAVAMSFVIIGSRVQAARPDIPWSRISYAGIRIMFIPDIPA